MTTEPDHECEDRYLRLAAGHDSSTLPPYFSSKEAWYSLVAIAVTFIGGTIASWFRKSRATPATPP